MTTRIEITFAGRRKVAPSSPYLQSGFPVARGPRFLRDGRLGRCVRSHRSLPADRVVSADVTASAAHQPRTRRRWPAAVVVPVFVLVAVLVDVALLRGRSCRWAAPSGSPPPDGPAQVDALTVAGFSAVPLLVGLTLAAVLSRRWPWVRTAAMVVAPVAGARHRPAHDAARGLRHGQHGVAGRLPRRRSRPSACSPCARCADVRTWSSEGRGRQPGTRATSSVPISVPPRRTAAAARSSVCAMTTHPLLQLLRRTVTVPGQAAPPAWRTHLWPYLALPRRDEREGRTMSAAVAAPAATQRSAVRIVALAVTTAVVLNVARPRGRPRGGRLVPVHLPARAGRGRLGRGRRVLRRPAAAGSGPRHACSRGGGRGSCRPPWSSRRRSRSSPSRCMTVPADLDDVSTMTLAVCHVVLAPVSVLALRALGGRTGAGRRVLF